MDVQVTEYICKRPWTVALVLSVFTLITSVLMAILLLPYSN
jgi:hypothetical protein